MGSYGDTFTLLYADDVRTAQETRLLVSMACYGDSFTLLYADNVRTAQKTRLWVSIACYGDSITFLPFCNLDLLFKFWQKSEPLSAFVLPPTPLDLGMAL
jgi:hypothetical protein